MSDLEKQSIPTLAWDSPERKQVEEALHQRVQFEKLIANLATEFASLAPAELDRGINRAFQILGEFVGVDRCHLFLFSEDGTRLNNTNEWCAEGVEPQIHKLQDLSAETFRWSVEQIRRLETVYIPRVVDLPVEAKAEKESLQAQGVRSVLNVPILYGEAAIGFMGFDSLCPEKTWTEDDTALLKIVGELFVSGLERKRTEEELRRVNTALEQRVKEREEVEVALRESEARFRQFISSISDHIYVTEVTEDDHRENLYLSPHVEVLTGYPLKEFMADPRFWSSKVIHPKDQVAAAAQLDELTQGHNSELEYRLVRSDGRVIWVRDSGQVQVEGTSKIIYGVVSDITERKQVELERAWLTNELQTINQTLDERVRARTAELQAIFDAAGEGIVVTDLDGKIQYVNPALERMTGYSEAEALEESPRLWKSDHQDANFYTQMWQTILAGQIWRGELINRRKNGSLYDVLLTITPIPGSDGRPVGFVGVQSDITPFKEMDRMKSEFISTAAHELRTPLTSILGFSEILLTRPLNEKQRTHYLNFINQQANALAAIIDDLLDLGRLESEQSFEMAKTLVNIKEVVEEVLFGFGENNPKHQYNLIGPNIWPRIKGDPAKLSQLFKNLFSNATKYSPDGGEITLEAKPETEYGLLHLTLTDQGIGMTPEQIVHIFDRFYRADSSNTATGGSGLGTTISQLIMERHGGKIWVESQYRVGTTFHLLFPLPNRPPHILIIEDDGPLRIMEKISLEEEGYAVLAAEEGDIGLELAQNCFPDLILLDLYLPKISGFEVLEQLQANYLTKDIPVIITSAIDRPEEIERAIEKGATDYQVKPYMMADLMVRINWVLNKMGI